MAVEVTVDIKDIFGDTDNRDKVRAWSPGIREAGDGLINSRPQTKQLVNGKATLTLEPGPVTVQFLPIGAAGKTKFEGVVPDTGPVTLRSVIEGDFTYTPPVVGEAQKASREAVQAADRAKGIADKFGDVDTAIAQAKTSETNAKASETAAKTSQTAAKTSETNANTSETNAGSRATEASTSATNAANSATAAKTSETNAKTSETNAKTSETNAGASATAAANSATAAANSATAASNSAASIKTSETNAGASATAAANSATAAGLAADRAELATTGKADLVDGKVPTSQIPEVALTKPSQVTSRAAMLALNAQEGDIAIITAGADKGTYILGSGASNVFASWLTMAVSSDVPVQSVNGQVGTVVLTATDVGASPTTHTHTPASLGAAPATHNHTVLQISDLPPIVSDTAQPWSVARRYDGGRVRVGVPVVAEDAAPKNYVDGKTWTSAQISDATDAATANTVVIRSASGMFNVNTPTASPHPASKSYVDTGLSSVYTEVYKRPALFSGAGAPPSSIPGAVVGDWWLNTTTMELSKITGV